MNPTETLIHIFAVIGTLASIVGLFLGGRKLSQVFRSKQRQTARTASRAVVQIQAGRDVHLADGLSSATPVREVTSAGPKRDELLTALSDGRSVSEVLSLAIRIAKAEGDTARVQRFMDELYDWPQDRMEELQYRIVRPRLVIRDGTGKDHVFNPPPMLFGDGVHVIERLLSQRGSPPRQGYYYIDIPTPPEWKTAVPQLLGDLDQIPIQFDASDLERVLEGVRRLLHDYALSK